jgi:tetratricopeptide (TPR) repeat protein
MTPEESGRIQTTVRDLIQKRRDQRGQRWTPYDPISLIQEATSASLLQDLSSAAFGLGGAPKQSQDTIIAYGIGVPYLPSTAKLQDLVPMKLSDLCMETHHRGRVLSLRRASPVVEMKSSSWAVFQGDSQNEVERLEIFLHTSKHGQNILNLGFEFLVKEPYYTLNNHGQPTIRIDHPSDLIFSTYNYDPESWRRRDRSEGLKRDYTSVECKELGNTALYDKNYAMALAHYTEGLRVLMMQGDDSSSSLKHDLYRNRSHVNLILERYDGAIADALESLTHGEDGSQKDLDAKAYFRAGTAAYRLSNFGDAKDYFNEQLKLLPGSRLASTYLKRIEVREHEMSDGVYDMDKALRSLSKTKGRPDAADFVRRTKVKRSSVSGKGLFAAEDIKTHDIIMCEKAFCIVLGNENEAFSALTCDVRDDAAIRVFPAGLHQEVVQKLMKNSSQTEKVLDLFGDYEGLGKKLCERDGIPVVDTFQIHDIVQRNAFGVGQQSEDEGYRNASTGLWIRASYMNHSCIGNAKKELVGDLMVIRATRRILAGEEIMHSYDTTSDYDARMEALHLTWGFHCSCRLCVVEAQDGPAVRKKRLMLEKDADLFIERTKPAGAGIISVNRAKRLRRSIEETYNEKRYKNLPRRALVGIEQWLQTAGCR